jgi:hypothetical protein
MEMTMKRKLNFREKVYLKDVNLSQDALRYDWPRRLKNALCALANMDPGWMLWVQKHVPHSCDVRIAARLVEVRARTLAMRDYRYLGESTIRNIIDGNRPFGDDGSLLPG